MEQMNGEQPWLAFKPHGWARRLAMLMVTVGIGRGIMRRRIRRLWFGSGPGTVADIVRYGLRWRVDASDNGNDRLLLFSSKEHDRREIRALTKACSTGVFVDIGANVGYFTVRLAGAGAHVVALEPNPIAYRRLLVNVSLNGLADRVTALPVGVGETGETTLSFGNIDFGTGSTVASEAEANTVTIRTSPLADILESQGIKKIDAMKVDVEGAEDRALAPFLRSVPRDMWPKCIVIEDSCRSRWEMDIIGMLLEEGYQKILRTELNLVLVR